MMEPCQLLYQAMISKKQRYNIFRKDEGWVLGLHGNIKAKIQVKTQKLSRKLTLGQLVQIYSYSINKIVALLLAFFIS